MSEPAQKFENNCILKQNNCVKNHNNANFKQNYTNEWHILAVSV